MGSFRVIAATLGGIVLLLSACGSASPRRVSCLGDSNTAYGWPDPTDRRWCEMLGEFPESVGTRIDNLARGGAILHAASTSWPGGDEQLAWASAAGRSDVIVLAFGTNDLRGGSSPRAVAHRYAALRRRAEARGAAVYVALAPPVWPPEPGADDLNRRIAALNVLLERSWPAQRTLDFHVGFTRDDFEKDGLHLNAAGQRKRAAIARGVLGPPIGVSADRSDAGRPARSDRRRPAARDKARFRRSRAP